MEGNGWGIRTKLFAGFGVMLLLMALLGAVGLVSTQVVGAVSDVIYHDHLVPMQALARVRGAFGALDAEASCWRWGSHPPGPSRSGTARRTASAPATHFETALADYEATLHSATAEERARK